MKFYVNDGVFQTGRNEVQEVLKLVVSTNEFDPNLYEMDEISAPKTRSAGADPFQGNTRALFIEDDPSAPSTDDWNTTQISMTIVRE